MKLYIPSALVVAAVARPSGAQELKVDKTGSTVPVTKSSISLHKFKDVLFTEVHDELHHHLSQTRETFNAERKDDAPAPRSLQSDTEASMAHIEDLWEDIIQHGWYSIQSTITIQHQDHKKRNLRAPMVPSSSSQDRHPFLICNRSTALKSGSRRLQPVLEATNAYKDDVIVVYNDDEQTCYHVSSTFEKATNVNEESSADGDLAIIPMTDIMKISVNTMEEITQDYWRLPSGDARGRRNHDLDHSSWERLIRVAFSAGDRMSHTEQKDVLSKASSIVRNIRALGQEGTRVRRRKLGQATSDEDAQESVQAPSLSNAFSLTNPQTPTRRQLGDSSSRGSPRQAFWEESLERGLEANHGCDNMFDAMEIRPQYNLKGFDIVLNPSSKSQDTSDIESSASNVHCISSLIMALSVQPSVLHVEVDTPIVADDLQAQWITQSKVAGQRPFTDAGLTGKGQIVSIIDSGCQVDHRYFGSTDESVFRTWDKTQRKIVRYDSSRGDTLDTSGGHGTSVAGVVAGASSSGEDEADGIAVGAKLHIFDMKKGNGMYTNPGPREILRSLYNNGDGAKIANGSWSTKYRAYPTSCRMYDDELYEDYQDVVFVASAGNYGRNPQRNISQMRTIGNPAGCKNTLAVGASQSEGERIGTKEMGMDYLALFSSRGPTADDRMKPDIIAPGYTIMTANAHPQHGETDKKQVFGTSYSAPVVAGNAALVRQYFEEGWFPCGTKGCGKPIQPSGSLVKAVLMNGGQDLRQVQAIIPNKDLLENVETYDSNQGMGLINLSASLPIRNTNRLKALAQNNMSIEDGEKHTFYIRAKTKKQCRSRQLSLTLAWYDKGGANGCAKCLVNDLDVWVQQLNNNGNIKKGSKKKANGTTTKDDRNNVERIRFNMAHNRRYRITINAANLSEARIKYSMIATGCFKVIPAPTRIAITP